MKKGWMISVLLIVGISLVGCGDRMAINTIQQSETNKEQPDVAEMMANANDVIHWNLVDYDLDRDYKRVEIGYEYYEADKKIKDERPGEFNWSEEEGDKAQKTKGKFLIAVDEKGSLGWCWGNGANYSSGSDAKLIKYRDDDQLTISSKMTSSQNIRDGEKVYVYAIQKGDRFAEESGEESGEIVSETSDLIDPQQLAEHEKSWVFYLVFSKQSAEN